jgi:hypothetical protein
MRRLASTALTLTLALTAAAAPRDDPYNTGKEIARWLCQPSSSHSMTVLPDGSMHPTEPPAIAPTAPFELSLYEMSEDMREMCRRMG